METRPVIINASNLELSIAGTVLLHQAGFTIHEGERVGVVGRNGAGKSTLMRLLAGQEEFQAGEVMRRNGLTVGYLPQEVFLEETISVRECILQGVDDLLALIRQFESLPHDSALHDRLEQQINLRDGWTLEVRLGETMSALETPEGDRLLGTLSGGEQRRVALCRTIIAEPQLLILDEPTNHLDTESIAWLETFLCRYPGTCMFVTHDRYFLDRVATRMLEVDRGLIHGYDGNYSSYLRAKAARDDIAEQQDLRRLRFLRQEIEWIRRGPKARGTKAQARIKRYEEAVDQQAFEQEQDIDLILPPPVRLANRVLECHHLGMELGGKTLFSGLTFAFEAGARIGVVGRNGVGKTTLLRLVLGELEPTAGKIVVGERTQFNYIDQQRALLDDDKTVFEEVGEGLEFVQLGSRRLNLWSYLQRFLFTDDEINTRVSMLSGGERNRILLAKTIKRGGNFLVLDEPTNDLDLGTLRILEEALCEFGGCVLVVSHDRFFLNRVCTGILGFEEDATIAYETGDYDTFVQKRQQRSKATARTSSVRGTDGKASRLATPKKAGLSWKLERELEGMEAAILAAESEVERFEAMFSQPDFYEKHGADSNRLTAELEAARNTVETLYRRWEELEKIKLDSEPRQRT